MYMFWIKKGNLSQMVVLHSATVDLDCNSVSWVGEGISTQSLWQVGAPSTGIGTNSSRWSTKFSTSPPSCVKNEGQTHKITN